MVDGTETITEGVKTSQQSTGTSMVTEEQAKERERKARSDALAELGRVKATADKALKEAQAYAEKAQKMEQERINAELEAHKGDPEAVQRIRAEQRANQLAADLAKKEQEATDREAKLQAYESREAETTKTQAAREIAERLGIDAEKLIKLSKRTDGSVEAIEEIAKELPRTSGQRGKPDSNSSRGGGGQSFTRQQIAEMTPTEYAANRGAIQTAYSEGKVK